MNTKNIVAGGGQFLMHTTDDGRTRVRCLFRDDTLWLTQAQMAELYQVSGKTISEHLTNVYDEDECKPERTIRKFRIVQPEGDRQVRRTLDHYSLEAILAVGYRVRSPRGVQFRRWASTVLKQYLLKGFTIDDERLKNPDGRPDYFDEMLARIRDIRASVKRFYQKVRELFALSSDYDQANAATQQFFATVQNMLLYAVTQQTAADLILARANAADPYFGLKS